MNGSSIANALDAVTAKWTRQRKQESRGSARPRHAALTRSQRISIRSVAFRVMPEAYLKASDNGRLPASARQIYYAARRQILEATGRPALDSHYFTQTLLPDYLASHRPQTARWDVTYDARGHFQEPHTGLVTPLGTLEVRDYLADVNKHSVEPLQVPDFLGNTPLPTCGPHHRFGAVLFIEKEGFMPLFEATHLAQRYDIALMSTKGMPVVACRQLADVLCGQYQIPLLVLHDFDKAGFSILGTLTGNLSDSGPRIEDYLFGDESDIFKPIWGGVGKSLTPSGPRYRYRNRFTVIDLGLRLEDVEEYDLESEVVTYAADASANLEANGATPEEIEFLTGGGGWDGQRVELNAFTSGDFVQWIEEKLQQHGIGKVVPSPDALATTYRRALQAKLVSERLQGIFEQGREQAEAAVIPADLEHRVRERLELNPELSWDQAVVEIARTL